MPTAFARSRATEEIDVNFEIECDDFTVPHRAFAGLRCYAEFRVVAEVEIDHSGDSITPDGAPSVDDRCLTREAWAIYLTSDDLEIELPDALQELLLKEHETEFEAAFIAAVGDSRINERCVEQALDC